MTQGPSFLLEKTMWFVSTFPLPGLWNSRVLSILRACFLLVTSVSGLGGCPNSPCFVRSLSGAKAPLPDETSPSPHSKLYEFLEELELQARSPHFMPCPSMRPSSFRFSTPESINAIFFLPHFYRQQLVGMKVVEVLFGFKYWFSTFQLSGFRHVP